MSKKNKKTAAAGLRRLRDLVEITHSFKDQLAGPDAAYRELTRMRRREKVLSKALTEIHKRRNTITPKEIKVLVDEALDALLHEEKTLDYLIGDAYDLDEN